MFGSHYIKLIFTGCAVVYILLSCAFFYHTTLEDSFISFRYAEHFSTQYKIGIWNYDEPPVEGYTSTLWVLILGIGKMFGIPVLSLSKVIGILSLIAIFLIFMRIKYFTETSFPDYDWNLIGSMSGIILILYVPFAWYSVSGMETILFSFLALLFICFSIKNAGSPQPADLFLGILLILTRPEGISIVLIIYFGILIQLVTEKKQVSIILLKILSIAIFQLGFILWRLYYYGYLFPNTYYAKVAGGGIGHLQLGFRYLQRALRIGNYWFLFVPIIFIIVAYIRKRKIPIIIISWIVLILFYLIYIIKVGGDNWFAFPYYRHLIHIFPLSILVFSFGLSLIPKYRNTIAVIVTIALVVLLNKAPVRYPGPISQELDEIGNMPIKHRLINSFKHDPPSEYVLWIKDHFPQNTRMAVTLGGELPYFTDFPCIDMLGLNNIAIAHNGVFQKGAVDTKTDMDYALNQRPDLIETTINANLILQNKPALRKNHIREVMENNLIENEIFKNEYLFIRNARYENFSRALFINYNFYQQIRDKTYLDVVRVDNTSLYMD